MKKGKIIWAFISVVMVLSLVLLPLLAGCGDTKKDDDGDGPAVPQEFVIKYHSVYGPNTYGSIALQEVWAPKLAEIAEGLGYTLTTEFYWNAALFSADAHTQALTDGSITMGSVGTYKMNSYDPRWNAFDMPLLVYDNYVKSAVLETAAYKDIEAKTEELLNFHILWSSGDEGISESARAEQPQSYHIFTKEEYPIHTMEDLAGLRIRTMTSPGQVEMGTALGFMAQAISFGEAPIALQTGMLEGLVTCPDMGYYVPLGVFDYCKCILWDTNLMAGYFPAVINSDFWWGLPDDLREAIDAYIPEYSTYVGNLSLESCTKAGDALKDAGFTITRLQDTPGELARWHAAVEPIWDDFAAEVDGGQELIDAIKACWAKSPWDPAG